MLPALKPPSVLVAMQIATEHWYRFVDVMYAAYDPWGDNDDYRPGTLEVELRKYRVLSHTRKGVWIAGPRGDRFVLAGARKRFACPTIEDARVSFIARKERQRGIYRARMERAQKALDIINKKQALEFM